MYYLYYDYNSNIQIFNYFIQIHFTTVLTKKHPKTNVLECNILFWNVLRRFGLWNLLSFWYLEKPRNKGFGGGSVAYVFYAQGCPRHSITTYYITKTCLENISKVYKFTSKLFVPCSKAIHTTYQDQYQCIDQHLYFHLYPKLTYHS